MLLVLCSINTSKIFVEILLRQLFTMESAEKDLSHVVLTLPRLTGSTVLKESPRETMELRGDVFPCAEQNCCLPNSSLEVKAFLSIVLFEPTYPRSDWGVSVEWGEGCSEKGITLLPDSGSHNARAHGKK